MLLLASVGLLWAASARASAPFSLHWDAPAQCPDSDYVSAQVETLLAGTPSTLVRVTARATAQQRNDGIWTVTLTTDRDGTVGERSIEADSCRSLADATALIVALTIDPAHVAAARTARSSTIPVASAPPPEPAPPSAGTLPLPASPTLPPSALTARPIAPAPEVEPSTGNGLRRRPPRFALFLAIAGDVGTLPHPAYGLSLSGSLLLGRFRAEIYGAYWPNQMAHGPPGTPPGEGGNIELFSGGLRACLAPLMKRLELSSCAGLEAGALRGEGVNLLPSITRTGPWLALTLDVRAVVRLTNNWGIVLDVGAAIPFGRPEFTFGNGSIIAEAEIVEGRVSVGPELRF
jgi:hypothetical protein